MSYDQQNFRLIYYTLDEVICHHDVVTLIMRTEFLLTSVRGNFFLTNGDSCKTQVAAVQSAAASDQ